MGNLEFLFGQLKKWKSVKLSLEERLEKYEDTFNGELITQVRFETKRKIWCKPRLIEETFSVTPKIAQEVLVEVHKREIERISNEIADVEAEIKSYIK